MKTIALILILLATGPEPIKSPPEDAPPLITSCINGNCRCTTTYAGCIDCIYANCDADWTDSEERLYVWWCRNRSRKGC